MWFLVLAAMLLGAGSALGQGRAGQRWSIGGFGNAVFPGTGHALVTTPDRGPGHFVCRNPTPKRSVEDPQVPPIVIVTSPVYDGGYLEDRSKIYDENQTHLLSNPAPILPMTINQGFTPSQGSPPTDSIAQDNANRHANAQGNDPDSRAPNDGRPTIYLIALKNHSVVRALGYWMEAGTLHYVSADYGFNQASMGRIDLEISQRLNEERGISFRFPEQK